MSSVKEGFFTDSSREECSRNEGVKVWGFGHMHLICQFYCGGDEDKSSGGEGKGKLVVANQRGYGRRECEVVVVERGEGDGGEWRVIVGGKEEEEERGKGESREKEMAVGEVEGGKACAGTYRTKAGADEAAPE